MAFDQQELTSRVERFVRSNPPDVVAKLRDSIPEEARGGDVALALTETKQMLVEAHRLVAELGELIRVLAADGNGMRETLEAVRELVSLRADAAVGRVTDGPTTGGESAPAGGPPGSPEAHASGADARGIVSRGGLPLPDAQAMSTTDSGHNPLHRPTYPHAGFEEALVRRYPNREDIQDYARLGFYFGFEPRVDSYEEISDAELDDILSFLQSQDGLYGPAH